MKVRLQLLPVIIVLFIACPVYGLKIDRVIVASDTNPTYLNFWPLVAQAWQKIVGIRPTLALIASKDVVVDETIGDVIRFEPISGVSTALQAQVIRLLVPALFANDVSIISDIDMLPLNKDYFINSVAQCPDDHFVVYRDGAYASKWPDLLPMCYVAAKGSVFKEVFGVYEVADIERIISIWSSCGYGWNTDEKMLCLHAKQWQARTGRCSFLGHIVGPRIDRSDWVYDSNKLKDNYYIDAHMLRPYNQYKNEIDTLAQLIGLIVDRINTRNVHNKNYALHLIETITEILHNKK